MYIYIFLCIYTYFYVYIHIMYIYIDLYIYIIFFLLFADLKEKYACIHSCSRQSARMNVSAWSVGLVDVVLSSVPSRFTLSRCTLFANTPFFSYRQSLHSSLSAGGGAAVAPNLVNWSARLSGIFIRWCRSLWVALPTAQASYSIPPLHRIPLKIPSLLVREEPIVTNYRLDHTDPSVAHPQRRGPSRTRREN
jgi:hypothetical protein